MPSWSSLSRHTVPVLLALRLVAFFSSTPLVLAASVDQQPYQTPAYQDRFTPADFADLTNLARAEAGLPVLHIDPELNAAAEAKAADMVQKGYWDHFRPVDHKTPWAFIEEAGYGYRVAGENLARGFRTPAGITLAWLRSPSHRANIMSLKYQDVGFACVQTVDADGQPLLLTVEMFGSR